MPELTYHIEYCHGTPSDISNWRDWTAPNRNKEAAIKGLNRLRQRSGELYTFRLVQTTWTPAVEILAV